MKIYNIDYQTYIANMTYNMQNFAYIFSGLETKPFKDYNIDLVDIELIDK